MRSLSFTVACAASILFADLPSQELLWETIGAKDVEWIGGFLAQVGDIDGDGYEDLITHLTTWGGGTTNRMRILSGKTGKTLLEFDPKVAFLFPQAPTGTGDMNGDGVPDFAVRIRDVSYRRLPNKVEVRNGKTGKLVWSVQESWGSEFGTSNLGDLDLDGDRKPDLVVASRSLWHPNNSAIIGGVWAFNNKGRLLYKITGNLKGLHIGLALGKVGDVDRDGKDDFVVGTNGYVPNGYGSAMLVSGATGKIIRHGIDKTKKYMVGLSVDGVGDIDRDGIPDFAASGGFSGQYPLMQVFSGRTGKILLQVQSPGQTHEISGRGFDFDKDGVPDIVRNAYAYRAPGKSIGSVFVLSGRDGNVLAQADRDWRSSGAFAEHIVALKPPPGSDFPLFAVDQWKFANNSKTNYQGRIAVYRGSPSGVADFGTNCKGPAARSRPEIGLRNLSGKRIRLQITNARPGSNAYLFLGYSNTKIGGSSLPLPLDALGFKGCSLLTSSDVVLVTQTGRSAMDAGYGRIDLNLPLAFPGKIRLFGQWAFHDNSTPGGWGFTRGLQWNH